jgi:4-hydroxythreonine-4-phosphate dehydrogenase
MPWRSKQWRRSLTCVTGETTSRPAFVEIDTIDAVQVKVGQVGAEGGRSVLSVLNRCMDAALAGDIDAICFAPLNKHAMKLGGLCHEDELHHFAGHCQVAGDVAVK